MLIDELNIEIKWLGGFNDLFFPHLISQLTWHCRGVQPQGIWDQVADCHSLGS